MNPQPQQEYIITEAVFNHVVAALRDNRQYDVAEYLIAGSRPAPAAPSQERIGSIRQNIYQEDAYLIERVNAGMGEWEYVIQYCGEYYATAPTENIARDIVERAQCSRPHPAHPTEAQQRIDAPLMRKEIVRIMIAGRHNNGRTYGEIADEIIALLQAGDQHE